jgi:hypothetical protein
VALAMEATTMETAEMETMRDTSAFELNASIVHSNHSKNRTK